MNRVYMRFPGGKPKALTLSYDDGVEQDIKLISIMVQYGLKGTFNLNSGIYAPEGTTYAPGTIHRRMSRAMCTELYTKNDMEVATHGYTHPALTGLPVNIATAEIVDDRRELERQFNVIVKGHAYPYGAYNDTVKDILKNSGICYARTVESTHRFDIPSDWLRLPATCHHADPELMELTDRFVNMDIVSEPALFYLWGHSYEFEEKENWSVIENFAEKISKKPDIWYATNTEIYDYVSAFRSLCFSTDCDRVYNSSGVNVWVSVSGKILEIPAGSTADI